MRAPDPRIALLLTLAACIDIVDDDLGVAPYDALGPYGIGASSFPLTTADGPTTAEVWFPALEREGTPYNYVLQYQRDALANATPDCIGPRPVALFSHGNGGVRFQSIFLTEFLASHGWVVIAPDHVDNTTFDEDDDAYGRVALRRPDDLARAYDAALELPLLEGCLDAGAGYVTLGHSFGGYTALVAAGADLDLDRMRDLCGDDRSWICQAVDEPEASGASLSLGDPRVWGAVAMAPAGWVATGPAGAGALTVPTLILGGTADTLTPAPLEQVPLYEALTTTPRGLALFEGASHYDFSDSCDLFPTTEFCTGLDDLPAAQTVMRAMTLAFLERTRGTGGDEAPAWLPPADDLVRWRDD